MNEQTNKLPVHSWCAEMNGKLEEQLNDLRHHPMLVEHIALMPDGHVGMGMPIGGVIAVSEALIPNAVGVDIGCGMIAVETNLDAEVFVSMADRRALQQLVKSQIPVGEGKAHSDEQDWTGFQHYLDQGGDPSFVTSKDRKNLGTLGGGNHFVELQKSEEGKIWLMIHSGSRNLGHRIASHYHEAALKMNREMGVNLPSDKLAYLPVDTLQGQNYLRDMNFALDYALENRHRMMQVFKNALKQSHPEVEFEREINIHHNYAAKEEHFGRDVYIHRKGATSAREGEWGIIPGSMGTSSYIVRGKGNPMSFMSCSHGAGRKLSRTQANKELTREQCDQDMQGIVCDSWKYARSFKGKATKNPDLSEAPLAYKDIDQVIASELDLIDPLVKLSPLAVLKG